MQKIMFSDKFNLTKAVLDGRKTMTRRIVRNPEEVEINGHKYLQTEKLRYKVGEVVAVAQSYKDTGNYPESYIIDEFHPNIEFEAGWKNKMYVRAVLMTHLIRITNVRVERMQDISDEDCVKEGVWEAQQVNYTSIDGIPFSPREAFAALIDKMSGKGTWASNPWVFVYEFELVK